MFRYVDRDGTCRRVTIRGSRTVTISCRGAGIDFSLDEPGGQGSLAVRLSLGGAEGTYYSMEFGGIFKAKSADAPVACPPLPGP